MQTKTRALDYLTAVHSSLFQVEDGLHAVTVHYAGLTQPESMLLTIQDDRLIAITNQQIAATSGRTGYAITASPPPYLLRDSDVTEWARSGLSSLITAARKELTTTIN